MRYMAAAGIALALAGCASVGDLRSKAPVFVGESTRAPEQYAGCVVEAWRSLDISPSYSPIPTGAEVIVMGIQPDIVLRAEKGQQSATRIVMTSRLPYGYSKMVKMARQCQ